MTTTVPPDAADAGFPTNDVLERVRPLTSEDLYEIAQEHGVVIGKAVDTACLQKDYLTEPLDAIKLTFEMCSEEVWRTAVWRGSCIKKADLDKLPFKPSIRPALRS
jgi:hypothetical protein